MDESVQDFEGTSQGQLLSTLGNVTFSATGSYPLVATDKRNASSGVMSLAARIPESTVAGGYIFNIASDQKVTFSFATKVAAFAIDINTFLGSVGGGIGGFFAEIRSGGVLLATTAPILSAFDPFLTNSKDSIPAGTVGQFIGFTSDTPFDSVTIGALESNPDKKLFSLDTLVTVDYEEPVVPEPPVPSEVPLPLSLPMLIAALGLLSAIRRQAA